ncbi:MAG: CAP domain-containing protein [Flavobacteriales bacterium]
MNILPLLFLALPLMGISQNVSSLEKEIHKVVNTYKLKTSKTSVALDSALSAQSRAHTRFMAETQELEHAELIKARGEIIQRTNNIDCTEAQVAKKVLTNFLNSPSHKEILDLEITKIGVGVVVEESGYVWVTIRVR